VKTNRSNLDTCYAKSFIPLTINKDLENIVDYIYRLKRL